MQSDDGYSWDQTPSSLALLHGNRVAWRHEHDMAGGKPFFHPLSTPNGPDLTSFRPADCPWHRGLWFSWKYINGLNYWEEDRQTGRSDGCTTLVGGAVTARPDFSARMVLALEYHPRGKEPVLTEQRVVTVSAPTMHGYAIDWESTFTARTGLLLGRAPIPGEQGGQDSGGYAGLSLRLAPVTRHWRLYNSQGSRGAAANGQRAHWVACDCGGRGIAILDHPENVGYPSFWYVRNDPKLPRNVISPAVLYGRGLSLSPGAELTLHYRVMVLAAGADASAFDAAWYQLTTGRH